MKFLTKLGTILVKATAVITGFAPLFPADRQAQVGQVRDTLADIASIVVSVETFGQVLGTPGGDKLRAASPMVAQIILTNLLAGKKVDDHVLFQKGVASVTSGIADVLNSLDDKIDTQDVV